MERKDQPIVIVDESRFDFVLHAVWLAAELRLDVSGLDRLTVFVFPLVRDFISLRLPLPVVTEFEDSGDFTIPGVADSLDLSKRVETVRFSDLLENRRALLRPQVRSKE